MDQLKGVRVLELASVLAGPSVGQFFAELGADVIKVENLLTGGDVTRTWKSSGEMTDDRSAYFCSVNWGKRSIALDLTTAEGQQIVHRLASRSDILIASYKPGDDRKLNVDYDTLKELNPGLIYGQVTGYGERNPRVGYDAIIQAEAGFMYMNGEPNGKSLKMPVALMDVLAGHHLKEGILLAMLEKSQTGRGKRVEVSLIQSAIASLANQATNWLVAGKLPRKQGSAHPNIAPYGDVFLTRDGKELLLAVGNDRQFVDLCLILGIPNVSALASFSTNIARVTNRMELTKYLQDAIKHFNSFDLVQRLAEARVPAGLIHDMQTVFEMTEAKEMLLSSQGLTGVKTFAVKDSLSGALLPPPHLGEHSNEILREIGF